MSDLPGILTTKSVCVTKVQSPDDDNLTICSENAIHLDTPYLLIRNIPIREYIRNIIFGESPGAQTTYYRTIQNMVSKENVLNLGTNTSFALIDAMNITSTQNYMNVNGINKESYVHLKTLNTLNIQIPVYGQINDYTDNIILKNTSGRPTGTIPSVENVFKNYLFSLVNEALAEKTSDFSETFYTEQRSDYEFSVENMGEYFTNTVITKKITTENIMLNNYTQPELTVKSGSAINLDAPTIMINGENLDEMIKKLLDENGLISISTTVTNFEEISFTIDLFEVNTYTTQFTYDIKFDLIPKDNTIINVLVTFQNDTFVFEPNITQFTKGTKYIFDNRANKYGHPLAFHNDNNRDTSNYLYMQNSNGFVVVEDFSEYDDLYIIDTNEDYSYIGNKTTTLKYLESNEEIQTTINTNTVDGTLYKVMIPIVYYKSLYFQPNNSVGFKSTTSISIPTNSFAWSYWVKFDTGLCNCTNAYLGGTPSLFPYFISETTNEVVIRGISANLSESFVPQTYKYTFEVSVMSSWLNDGDGEINVYEITANDNTLNTWDKFKSVSSLLPYIKNHTDSASQISKIIDGNVHLTSGSMKWSAQVGTKVFELYTNEPVTKLKIWYKSYSTFPGWKIYENDTKVVLEETSIGSLTSGNDNTYTYFKEYNLLIDPIAEYKNVYTTLSKGSWHHICRVFILPDGTPHSSTNIWNETYYINGNIIYSVDISPIGLRTPSYFDSYPYPPEDDTTLMHTTNTWEFDLYWNYARARTLRPDDNNHEDTYVNAQIAHFALWMNNGMTQEEVNELYIAGFDYDAYTLYNAATHYYPFGNNNLMDNRGVNDLQFFYVESNSIVYESGSTSLPLISFPLAQPPVTISELLNINNFVIYTDVAVNEFGDVSSFKLIRNLLFIDVPVYPESIRINNITHGYSSVTNHIFPNVEQNRYYNMYANVINKHTNTTVSQLLLKSDIILLKPVTLTLSNELIYDNTPRQYYVTLTVNNFNGGGFSIDMTNPPTMTDAIYNTFDNNKLYFTFNNDTTTATTKSLFVKVIDNFDITAEITQTYIFPSDHIPIFSNQTFILTSINTYSYTFILNGITYNDSSPYPNSTITVTPPSPFINGTINAYVELTNAYGFNRSYSLGSSTVTKPTAAKQLKIAPYGSNGFTATYYDDGLNGNPIDTLVSIRLYYQKTTVVSRTNYENFANIMVNTPVNFNVSSPNTVYSFIICKEYANYGFIDSEVFFSNQLEVSSVPSFILSQSIKNIDDGSYSEGSLTWRGIYYDKGSLHSGYYANGMNIGTLNLNGNDFKYLTTRNGKSSFGRFSLGTNSFTLAFVIRIKNATNTWRLTFGVDPNDKLNIHYGRKDGVNYNNGFAFGGSGENFEGSQDNNSKFFDSDVSFLMYTYDHYNNNGTFRRMLFNYEGDVAVGLLEKTNIFNLPNPIPTFNSTNSTDRIFTLATDSNSDFIKILDMIILPGVSVTTDIVSGVATDLNFRMILDYVSMYFGFSPGQALPPSNITILSRTSTSLTLSWSGNSNGVDTLYHYIVHNVTIGTSTQVGINTSYNWTHSLSPNTGYIFKVEKVTSSGSFMSEESSLLYTDVSASAPNAPTLVSLSVTTITIRWTPNSNGGDTFTKYVITNVTLNQSYDITDINTKQYQWSGLDSLTAYTFSITKVTNTGNYTSPFSEPFTTLIAQPEAPDAPTYSNIQTTSLTLLWIGNSHGDTYLYNYYVNRVDLNDQNIVLEQKNSGTNTTYTWSNLTHSTEYSFTITKVTTYNGETFEKTSNSSKQYTLRYASAVTVYIETYDYQSITIGWYENSNGDAVVSGYTVNVSGKNPVTLENVTSYTISDLEKNTSYNIFVTKNTNLNSPISDVNTQSTRDIIYPEAVTVTVTNFGMDSISISWAVNQNNDGIVSGYTVNVSGKNPVTLGNVTSYTITNLTHSTQYSISVTKHTDLGSLDAVLGNPVSAVITQQTSEPAPPSPPTISEKSKTNTTITIQWVENYHSVNTLIRYDVYIYNLSDTLLYGPINVNTSTEYHRTGLNSLTTYKFKVVKVTTLGEATSTFASIQTLHTSATTPTVYVNSNEIFETSMIVRWNANSNGDAIYVSYKVVYNNIETTSTTASYKTISSLTKNTAYTLRVEKLVTYPSPIPQEILSSSSINVSTLRGNYSPSGNLIINNVTWNGSNTFTAYMSKSGWETGVPTENYYLYFQNNQIQNMGTSLPSNYSYNSGQITGGNYTFQLRAWNSENSSTPVVSNSYNKTLNNPNFNNHTIVLNSITNASISITHNTNVGGDFNTSISFRQTQKGSTYYYGVLKTDFTNDLFVSSDTIYYQATITIENGTSHSAYLNVSISNYFESPSNVQSITNLVYASPTLSFTITNASPINNGTKNGATLHPSYPMKIRIVIKNASGQTIETHIISDSEGNRSITLSNTATYDVGGTFTVEANRWNNIYYSSIAASQPFTVQEPNPYSLPSTFNNTFKKFVWLQYSNVYDIYLKYGTNESSLDQVSGSSGIYSRYETTNSYEEAISLKIIDSSVDVEKDGIKYRKYNLQYINGNLVTLFGTYNGFYFLDNGNSTYKMFVFNGNTKDFLHNKGNDWNRIRLYEKVDQEDPSTNMTLRD